MNKSTVLFCVVVLFACVGFAQTVTLTFTGRDGGNNHLEFDYVSVTNVTKGWQEYLFWPDTVLTLQNNTGISDVMTDPAFSLQLSPNPFDDATEVTLSVVEEGVVHLEIVDVNGHPVGTNNYSPLQPGTHQFHVTLAHAGTYVMTARQNGKTSSVKLVCTGGGKTNTVDHVGVTEMGGRVVMPDKSYTRGLVDRPFDLGDQMEFVAYAVLNEEEVQSQQVEILLADSQTVVLPFSAIPLTLPVVITSNVTDITGTSVICGGDVIDDGGDSMALRGVCISTSPSPTIEGRHTVDGCGMGAFTSYLTGLSTNLTYYVRAYATNYLGTAYGEEWTFFIPIDTNGDTRSCPGTPYVIDVDRNMYNTIQIGQQCWMRENLRTTRYADETPIPEGDGSSTTVGRRYYPMNNPSYVSNYGLLYNWLAAMRGAASSNANPSGVQGVCPDGWHLPSDAECTQLLDYVNGQSQNVCGGIDYQIGRSLAATVGWGLSGLADTCTVGNPNLIANNATGFGALPAGFYNVNALPTVGSVYGGLGYVTFYWTSTANHDAYGYNNIYYWGIHQNDVSVIHHDFADTDGEAQSVRCVMNG